MSRPNGVRLISFASHVAEHCTARSHVVDSNATRRVVAENLTVLERWFCGLPLRFARRRVDDRALVNNTAGYVVGSSVIVRACGLVP